MKKSLTTNKISAAAILALAVAWIAGAVSESVVEPQKLEKNAFVVDTSAIGGAAAATAAPAAAAIDVPPIAPLLAAASTAAGEKYAKVCSTCHSFGKGEAAKVGPNLYGIIGSKHAHMAGYKYSDAMAALSDKPWNYEELNKFLSNPRGYISGTKMGYSGIKSDSDRANVIAWLRTLSDSPEPLPKK